MRIAMWSGPRNLSTAMMYSFAARGDCFVWDEPFYAAYLAVTGLDHPMRSQILQAGETDAKKVADQCQGAAPDGARLFYQKHMTQHMVEAMDRGWMGDVKNVFLIRHPARVIASYAKKRERPSFDDIGFWQQAELFEQIIANGDPALVIDASDIRHNPAAALTVLCAALDLSFTPAMLHWPKGGHTADGVWAPHWYGAVHQSTGFAGPEGPLPKLSGDLANIACQALPFYEKLATQKLRF